MAANSLIQWTDHTFNPWIGCTKISPGCAHCYAETIDRNRFSRTLGPGTKDAPVSHWGPGAPRHRTAASTWAQPLQWNRGASATARCGHPGCGQLQPNQVDRVCIHCGQISLLPRRPRVFSASLADWLDPEVPIEWLADFLKLVHDTPNLDWLLLSKRPELFEERLFSCMLHAERADMEDTEPYREGTFCHWLESWKNGWDAPANVWIGTTVENQESTARHAHLMAIPAAVHFWSVEPMLSAIATGLPWGLHGKPDWVICGGESGKDARPMHPDWARGLRDQCVAAGVPFFFKQWGDFAPIDEPWKQNDVKPLGKRERWVNLAGGHGFHGEAVWRMRRVGTDRAGRVLDGREWNELPAGQTSKDATGGTSAFADRAASTPHA